MSAAESFAGMHAVSERPNDSISKKNIFLRSEDRVDQSVKWDGHPILNMMTYLPAQAPAISESASK